MKLKPLFDNLLIEPEEATNKTKSGIILADSAKEAPQTGKVISVGKDVESLKAGNTVIFKKWSGDEIKEDGKTLKLVKEEDVLAIVS